MECFLISLEFVPHICHVIFDIHQRKVLLNFIVQLYNDNNVNNYILCYSTAQKANMRTCDTTTGKATMFACLLVDTTRQE